jgi:hypothetical protein
MATRAEVRDIAEQTYYSLGPILGVHSVCRLFMVAATAAARALGVPCDPAFEPDYREDGQRTPHFWLEFQDGSRLDLWLGQVRLLPPAQSR